MDDLGYVSVVICCCYYVALPSASNRYILHFYAVYLLELFTIKINWLCKEKKDGMRSYPWLMPSTKLDMARCWQRLFISAKPIPHQLNDSFTEIAVIFYFRIQGFMQARHYVRDV